MVKVKNNNIESRRINREMHSHATSDKRTNHVKDYVKRNTQDAPHNTMSATK